MSAVFLSPLAGAYDNERAIPGAGAPGYMISALRALLTTTRSSRIHIFIRLPNPHLRLPLQWGNASTSGPGTIGRRISKRLPHVLVIQFRVLGSQLGAIRIEGERFEHPTHGKPLATNTWLTFKDGWVGNDSVEFGHGISSAISFHTQIMWTACV